MTTLRLRAHAKLNLALAVGPPEPADSPRAGWHPIASWFHSLDLHDSVELAATPPDAPNIPATHEMRWEDGSPVGWALDRDLALRAVRLAEKLAERPLPVRLRIIKRIPEGGGLGGGSADAAAVLIGLNALFRLNLTPEQLREHALSLGSDVPYFIDDHPSHPFHDDPPRPALVTCFGDRLERLTRHTGPVTLFLPPFGCPTGDVYRAFDGTDPGPLREEQVRALTMREPESETLFNDLAPAAERLHPELVELRTALAEACRCPVHMTGSGSTLFALGDHGDVLVPDGVRSVRTSLC